MPQNVVKHLHTYIVLSLCLLLCFSNIVPLLAQEETPPAEPPTVEPPTPEPPTSEPPTAESPTIEPPTATFTELPPPTATDTELPPPSATNTELPTLTPTETETTPFTPTITKTTTASPTASPPPTVISSETPTATLTPTALISPTFPPATPGISDYRAWLQEAQSSAAQLGRQSLLDETCATDINTNFAVVAPTTVNNRAVDFYAAIGQAHQGGSASPYPIYLCEGTFPLNETVILFADVRIYGRGVDVSIITQSDTTQMGGMFTLNDNHLLEFHNVTLYNGRARITDAGAVLGGAVRVHSGTLRVHDSKFQGNEAAFLGGAIAGGVNIELVRSHFLGNLADDSGGVLYVANATAECARFDTNIAVLYRGGALAIDGGGVINGSSFSGNQAGQEANDIFNYNWGDPINAQGNWWATPPQTPDIISGGVDASAALGSDPTADYVTGDYYNPALGECQMHTPEPLPPPPTPTPTPTPDTCEVIATNAAAKLRIQPALDDQNWLFEVPATYVYYNDNTVVNGAALPARDWLWPDEDRPDSLTLTAIYVIARVGVIGWVDPDVDWIQVEVLTDELGFLTGYMERTDTSGNEVLPLFACNLGALPTPTPDPGMPGSSLNLFANYPPQGRVHDGNQSPSVMGDCGQHIGAQNPCSPSSSGSTIDIVPRNHELCIDTRGTISECDPTYIGAANPSPTRVPLYAPGGGCATFDNTATPQVIIRLFRPGGTADQAECNTPIQNDDRLIVLTHITNSPIVTQPNRQPITANTLVGYLCLNGNSNEAYNVCQVFAPSIPTHLAFQLQVYSGSYQQAPNDIVGYLARQGCLYDDWEYDPGNPQVQLSPIKACP